MNMNVFKTILCAAAVIPLLSVTSYEAYATSPPKELFKGRIALTSEGNHSQLEDIGSTPFSLALLAAAKLQKKLVYLEFNNHIWGDVDNVAPYENIWSVRKTANFYKFDDEIIFNARHEQSEAIETLTTEINVSSANNPLYILAGGPLAVTCEAIKKADKRKLPFVYLVSYSNADRNKQSQGSCKYSDLKAAKFPIKYINLPDQTAGFTAKKSDIAWLTTEGDDNLKKVYGRINRLLTTDVAKVPDAGMVWYLIKRDPRGTLAKTKEYFKAAGMFKPVVVKPPLPPVFPPLKPVILKDTVMMPGLKFCKNYSWITPVSGYIVRVANMAELKTALAAAKGGEIILAAGGNYGKLDLLNYAPPSTVTIGSADKANPPVFSMMTLDGVKNLKLAGLKFIYEGPVVYHKIDGALDITKSENITILNSLFEGFTVQLGQYIPKPDPRNVFNNDLTGFGAGQGINIEGSKNIDLLGSTFKNFTVGTNYNNTITGLMKGNTIIDSAYDSMDFGGVQNVVVDGNYVPSMKSPAGLEHKDLIQLRKAGTRTENFQVINNVLVSTQNNHALWFGNENAAESLGVENFYRNIKIADNKIYSSHPHGIAVNQVIGLEITNNILARNMFSTSPLTTAKFPRISVLDTALNVVVTGNTTAIAPRAFNTSTASTPTVPTPAAWNITNNTITGLALTTPPMLTAAPGCIN